MVEPCVFCNIHYKHAMKHPLKNTEFCSVEDMLEVRLFVGMYHLEEWCFFLRSQTKDGGEAWKAINCECLFLWSRSKKKNDWQTRPEEPWSTNSQWARTSLWAWNRNSKPSSFKMSCALKWTCLQNRNRLTDAENRLAVAKREGRGGGMDWEFGVSRCKLLHLEWISNEVLL